LFYRAHTVASDQGQACRGGEPIRLTGPVGYIRSYTMDDKDNTQQSSCPFSIEVGLGQRINLTLLNFNMAGLVIPSSGTGVHSSSSGITAEVEEESSVWRSGVCYDYATLAESLGATKQITICGGEQREKHLYESKRNTIDVMLVNKVVQQKLGAFLIKYEGM